MDARHDKLKIIAHRKISGPYFHLVLEGGRIAASAQPGQFVMVKVSDCQIPLLRRPLGIHSTRNGHLGILYEVVGRGTAVLSEKKPGEYLDIIGPLGHGFDFRRAVVGSRPLLVAGGMGVAPLLFLAEKLKKVKATVLLGAKTKSHILCEKEFKEIGCDVTIATNDGSRGYRGTVSALLSGTLATRYSPLATSIYACGPEAMLASVAAIAVKHNISAFGSFEAHMACGIGACMGCVMKLKTDFEYKRVCKDGPVFPLNQVVF